jgi:Tol biopolymer transport system component
LGEAGAYVESSVVSPDGRQVAYIWDGVTASNGENTEELRIIQMKGGKAAESRGVHLNHGYMGVHGWSPDGKSVVVVREQREGTTYTSQIAIISIPGGAVRVLKKGIRAGSVGGASFSPDGRYVAYHARDGDNTTDIFVVAHDGSETRLVESPGDDRNPMWSPDGSHIVFLSTRTGSMSVWMVPVSGGRATGPAKLVKSDVGRFIPMGITRSGSLHYISGSSIVNVHTAELNARLNAGAAPSMATNINVNSNIGGVWSPDGQSLAYHTVSPRGVFIRIRSAATGQDREVPAQIIVSGPVRWFPNGQSLLVASRDARVGGGPVGYYRVNVTTGNADLLHQTTTSDVVASRPDLSSDGNTIFYLETPQQPVRFDLDSRRETRLPPVGGRSLSLAVSPDGSQIAYLSGASLVTAPAVGGEPRQLVRFPGGSKLVERQEGLGLAWSPDQRHVFFVKPNIPAIWRVPAAGGEAENIGISMNRIRALRMHPDGRRITFDSVIDAPSELWVLENFLPKPVARR